MKTRLFTIALLLAASLSGFAQDKNALRQATQKMIELNDQENYDNLIGTVYPKVFDITSKEEYLQKLQNKKGDGYTIHMVRVDPSIDYGAVKNFDTGYFCIVNYSTMMSIELSEKVAEKDRPAKEEYFKKLLNTEHVYYLEADNTIAVKKRVQAVAIADDSTSGQWTFINPEDPAADKLLSQTIKNELDPNYTGEPEPQNIQNNQDTENSVQNEVEKKAAEKAALSKKKKS